MNAAVATNPVLHHNGSLGILVLEKPFKPKKFFQKREGMDVWKEFSDGPLLQISPSKQTDQTVIASADIMADGQTYDREIWEELPGRPELELWHIAQLIEEQKKGQDGVLLTNGYANIFYVGDFAVFVYSSARCQLWTVRAWKVGVGKWIAGARIFYHLS